MKLKNILIPLIAVMMLGACKPTTSSSNGSELISSGNVTTSENTSLSTSSSSSDEDPFKDVESLHTGSLSGSLVEISVGEHLQVGQTYECGFVPSDCESKKMTVEYDTSVIQLTFNVNSDTVFKIKALKKGATVLKLRSTELDCLVYREVIRVDEMVPTAAIEDYLFSVCDTWKTSPLTLGLAGQFKLTFTSNAPLTMVLSGGDELEANTRAVIELTYKTIRKNYDFMFYVFEAKLDTERSTTSRKFDEILVTCTGNSIYVYDDEGLINIFYQA